MVSPGHLFLFLTLFGLSTASVYKVNPTQQAIIDPYNRVSIFHGVNAVFKEFPYYPITTYFDSNFSLCDTDYQNLLGWGFNMIRLYVSWQGTVSSPGQYNYTYLEQVRNIVRTAATYNISILLDAHQDLLARKFCGEGFPNWAVTSEDFPDPWDFNITDDSEGYPETPDCLDHPFFEYYFTEDVQRTLNSLYTNQNGLADALGDFWAVVAGYFKDEPNVLGYELLNEPFGADIYKNPLYFFDSGKNDIDHLVGLYQNLSAKIRAVDNETIIFFEPTVSDFFRVDMPAGPGGLEYNDRQVFSYHVYCPLVDDTGEPKSQYFCAAWDWGTVKTRAAAAQKIGVPGFMTEFGALSNSESSAEEVQRVTSLAESYFHSWSYWQFKYYDDITTAANPATTESFYNNNGTLQLTKIKALSRPYAPLICGVPVSTSFDPDTSEFQLVIQPNNNCNGMNTELYLSESFYYPNGTNIQMIGCEDCQLTLNNQNGRYELVLPQNWANSANAEVTITVTAN